MTRQWKKVVCVVAATMLMGTTAMAANGNRGNAGTNAGQVGTAVVPLGEITEARHMAAVETLLERYSLSCTDVGDDLGAFVNQLVLIGEIYDAQYLSAEEMEEILADDTVPGKGKGQGGGNGTGTCRIQASLTGMDLLLAGKGRGGSGGGGNGGGQGPQDGTGNGPKTGGCVNNATAS